MTYFQRITAAFSICFVCAVAFPSNSSAQTLIDDAWQNEFSLGTEDILGEASDAEGETLSRLVDKSEFSNLEFLNLGEAPTSIEQLKAMQEHVAQLYGRIEPAVVNIQSRGGQGSGVVISSDGYILTAAHVISVPNRSAMITFPDGTRARAQTLGLFRNLDAGLLKIYEMIPNPVSEEAESSESAEDSKEESKSDVEDDEADKDSDDEDSDKKDSEEDEDDDDSDSEEDSDQNSDEDDSAEDDSDEDDNKPAKPKSDNEDESGSDDKKSDSDDDEDETKEEPKKAKKARFAVQEDLPSFPYLEIGDSAALNLGQWVVAVGHPGGLDKERGIVLRIGRINELRTDSEEDDKSIYLRTDCTLVGGDSGGPLIGMDGSVIGIHSRIGVQLKQNFHVPANDFLGNWKELLEPVVHDRKAEMLVVFRNGTNVITAVPRNSLAARNGLKAADRIVRIDEHKVYDKLQFEDVMSKLKPYQTVEIEVLRKGKKQILEATVGEKRERGLR